MADDGLDGLDEESSGGSAKKGGIGGLIPSLLKWIAIALGAIILIVVIVVVTMKIVNKGGPGPGRRGGPCAGPGARPRPCACP